MYNNSLKTPLKKKLFENYYRRTVGNRNKNKSTKKINNKHLRGAYNTGWLSRS